jgi:excisionase family DNA binding protein
MDTRFLTTTQTAQLLGVSRQTVLAWLETGKLVGRIYRVSGQRPLIRISEEAVADFIARWSDDGGQRDERS